MDSIKEEIGKFWNWFQINSKSLEKKEISHKHILELEQNLFAIHKLDWELGPGRSKPFMLSLSPNGDPNLFELTKQIVEEAPLLDDWEFFPAKPPRDWNLVFQLSYEGREVLIDGKQWEFLAFKFKDGTFDLDFKPVEGIGLPDEYLNWAATILVDGELGEDRRIRTIANIATVKSWSEEHAPSARLCEPGLLSRLLVT